MDDRVQKSVRTDELEKHVEKSLGVFLENLGLLVSHGEGNCVEMAEGDEN